MVALLIFLAAWVISPLVFIPVLVSMSSKMKKKDEEIRRLNARLGDLSSDKPERAVQPENNLYESEEVKGTKSSLQEFLNIDDIPDDHIENIHPENEKAVLTGEKPPVREQKITRPVNTRPVKVKRKLEPSQLLFGVGVILVFVAGLIFATSMWSVMPSIIKVTTLVGAAMFFVLVAWILEVKLKLREASVTMFVLGSAFMALAVIAIGYFEWFGPAFSLGASSRYLVISVSLWVLCLTLLFGYRLYGSIVFMVISYISSYIALALLVRHISGKGDVALLFTGIYALISQFIKKLKKTWQIMALGYAVISLLLYLAFGFNIIMSLVMLIDIALIICVASGSQTQGEGRDLFARLYYAVPVFGSLFIYNTSDFFRFAFPHGDIPSAVILCVLAFFIYDRVRIKGERRLSGYLSLVTVIISFLIPFFGILKVMNRGHEGIGDITEVLPGLIAFLAAAALFTFEYLRTIRPLKGGCAVTYVKAYMASLCLLTVLALYTLMPIARYFNIKNARYLGSLIPAALICAVMLPVILLYQYRLATGSLEFRIRFTEFLGSLILNVSVVVSFVFFTAASHVNYTSYLLNIPLIAAMLMYQVHIRLKHNNPDGLVTALMLPFVLMAGIDKLVETALPNSDSVWFNTVFEIKLLMFLSVLIIGLFVYRKLFSFNRENKRLLIDWNAFMALLILAAALFSGDTWDVEHVAFKACIALAVFALYVSRKLTGLARQAALAVMTGLLCMSYAAQDFISWNRDFETELIALSLIAFSAVTHLLIFRRRNEVVAWMSFGLSCIFLLIQFGCISSVYSKEAMPVVNLKVWLFLLVTFGVTAFCLKFRGMKYEALSLVLAVLLAIACTENWRRPQLILAVILCTGLIVFHYRLGHQPFTLAPIITLLYVIYETMDLHLREYLVSEKFSIRNDILVRGARDYSLMCLVWIIIFAAMLALGRFLHPRVAGRLTEESPFRIDWFGICAILPVIFVLERGNDKFVWSVWLLAAIYLFSYYGRIRAVLNKPLLTAVSVCIAVAWWTQPLIRIRELFVTEYRIIGFLLLVFVITKVIFKKELEGGLDFMFYASCASVIWQSVSAIRSASLFDVIILGVVLLAMIIIAFEKRSRQWFLLSSISLVCIFLYMSRDFWRKIVWPVYVFAVGLVLIFFATRNEYRKKHPVPEEDKRKLFENWNK